MIYKIVIILLVILRLTATGLREGCMWTDKWREGLPIGYHFWRSIDSIIFAIILMEVLGFWLAISTLAFAYTIFYERALQYVNFGELFNKQNPWGILKWEIPITNIHMVILGVLGLAGIILQLFII